MKDLTLDKSEVYSVIYVLLGILDGNIHDENFGVCFNLSQGLRTRGLKKLDGYNIVSKLSVGWEHHTGDWINPVPKELKDDSQPYRPWEGLQRDLRVSLIKHQIQKLEEYKRSL
jgi:hypothetical protein